MTEKKPHQVRVYPSLLAADASKWGEEIVKSRLAGADDIHVDIADGRFRDKDCSFTPHITFGPDIIAHLKKLMHHFFPRSVVQMFKKR